MKKFVLLVTAAVLLLSTSVFATELKDVNAKVKAAFQKDFLNATNVSWDSKDNFYFADFNVNDTRFNAAYNEDGQLVAISRLIKLEQLPLAVTQALNEKYQGYSFGGTVTELVFESQTSYFISAVNQKHVLRLKANGDGYITLENKTKI